MTALLSTPLWRTRCKNCDRQVPPGKEFWEEGECFCNPRCREYFALVVRQNAARLQSPMVIVALVLLIGMFVWAVSPRSAKAHDWYTHEAQNGDLYVGCCSGDDCSPSRAYLDLEDGLWRAWNPRANKWVTVPQSQVKGHAPDGRTHWCGNDEHTYCFWPGDTKS